ncbi:hypothetical protein GCM10010121_099750 [Streptomyces brasiliensis]|uniref:Uncharacterized protein n=1 Tax=Streptomyces brasiliensis TaxID=1954 RepID=A0A917PEF0_9ACTN|nr:hypothetical protein GCM10010121_099750 [Streptomyces brasiliensis]
MGRELPHEGEVVHPGDAEHGGVNAVAFQAAVAKDLTRKWLYEGRVDCPGCRAGV